ncbi:PPP4R2-domain-containing protein [Roridomyces roridus]|uniref:PPP4R2-domain-containing protein n=1 Tax=Roridomyces roridus TaxID=1738132 RepID=A0AAD7BW63_9AGAR|nr:PPP4R2-domain-containing protein [Roridomyces roridus]
MSDDAVLQQIASTDKFDSEWPKLRDMIKNKINQNIALFLSGPGRPPPAPQFQPQPSATGGLKLPPFLPRKAVIIPPVNYMSAEEAAEMERSLHVLLDQFDSSPPFTIQRVCELCLYPKQNYNSVGKYLRAVEKSLLVTSSYDSFPPLTEAEKDTIIRPMASMGSSSAPATPIFSPIPFLHDDARRSKSRSPPPSPLILANIGEAHPDPIETKALGLVDELDDPSPGHMSEHPVALTSVTTTSEGEVVVESLEDRFVRGQEQDMAVDEDKENAHPSVSSCPAGLDLCCRFCPRAAAFQKDLNGMCGVNLVSRPLVRGLVKTGQQTQPE